MKKFKESLNTAVFTTRYVLEGAEILFVFHDEDGSWQFHGKQNEVKDEDIRIIALSEIIKIDDSILEVADLPVGYEASRNGKGKMWNIINPN